MAQSRFYALQKCHLCAVQLELEAARGHAIVLNSTAVVLWCARTYGAPCIKYEMITCEISSSTRSRPLANQQAVLSSR
ncbi:hypothetical protein Y032_0379g318 [Ancylostoma ceylanicum]|uniref:Uncharacterized protein n=1 Tax=Ancylostoma ceylanicum TaxID=53326 RepID=A0A016RTF6_9BILA|nr:hypothetical protein Y032_0379g318 [Ancylostoma ceylanicum]